MRTLIFLLISNICIAQSGISLMLRLQRIGVNSPDKIDEIARVKFLLDPPYIGIMTPYDTLILERKDVKYYSLYEDKYNDNQLYDVDIISDKTGFLIFVTPYKPYKRRLHSLIFSGL